MSKMSELAYLKDKYGDKDYIQFLEDKLEEVIELNYHLIKGDNDDTR